MVVAGGGDGGSGGWGWRRAAGERVPGQVHVLGTGDREVRLPEAGGGAQGAEWYHCAVSKGREDLRSSGVSWLVPGRWYWLCVWCFLVHNGSARVFF